MRELISEQINRLEGDAAARAIEDPGKLPNQPGDIWTNNPEIPVNTYEVPLPDRLAQNEKLEKTSFVKRFAKKLLHYTDNNIEKSANEMQGDILVGVVTNPETKSKKLVYFVGAGAAFLAVAIGFFVLKKYGDKKRSENET